MREWAETGKPAGRHGSAGFFIVPGIRAKLSSVQPTDCCREIPLRGVPARLFPVWDPSLYSIYADEDVFLDEVSGVLLVFFGKASQCENRNRSRTG